MAESGHWYDRNAELVSAVPMKTAEGTRPPTLADARKLNLVPSVTTVLKLLDKPALVTWAVGQAIEAAWRLPLTAEADPKEHLRVTREEANRYRDWAAEIGTKIHLGIETGQAVEPEVDEIVQAFGQWVATSPLVIHEAERRFVSPLGYAGTVDAFGTWHGQPAIVDYKTQDFDDVKDVTFWDEHVLQLSGYAIGTREPARARVSLVISRTVPGLVGVHHWQKDVDRWDNAWLSLWQTWQHMKNYYPQEAR
jgi:hypothetical protein